MKKFKRGDRVNVYGAVDPVTRRFSASYSYGKVPATVVNVEWGQECLEIEFDYKRGYRIGGVEAIVHAKQCRRLVKRKKSGAI